MIEAGPKQAGFTLLEVLAALVVLGLILAALTSGVRFGQQALQAQARDTAVANGIEPVDNVLRSLISRAWPNGQVPGAAFLGTEQPLTFRTTMPAGLASMRTSDANVAIGVDAMHRLVLTWLPWYRNWIVLKPVPQRIALLDNVDHVEFGYWDPSLNLPPGGWAKSWTGIAAPKLLRIRVVLSKGNGRPWPDMIIATERDPWVL